VTTGTDTVGRAAPDDNDSPITGNTVTATNGVGTSLPFEPYST
jgi:hypothetical protein